ncbi:MAG: dTMP kinase [Thermoprotei archaeon]
MLVVFEGIDCSGKSTQAKALAERLENTGLKVSLTSEPTHGLVGEFIRKHVLNKPDITDPFTVALLFAADRANHLSELNFGDYDVVVFDRYYFSSVAYQTSSGAPRSFVEGINSFAPKPDHVFLLDLPAEVSVQRKSKRDKLEGVEFLKRVRETYLSLAKEFGFTVLDATKPASEVSEQVFQTMSTKVSKVAR